MTFKIILLVDSFVRNISNLKHLILCSWTPGSAYFYKQNSKERQKKKKRLKEVQVFTNLREFSKEIIS